MCWKGGHYFCVFTAPGSEEDEDNKSIFILADTPVGGTVGYK